MNRRSNIRWTEEEKDLIKERLVELLKENPRIKKVAAFREAQEILDASRHKSHLSSICSTITFRLLWATACKEVNLVSKTPTKTEIVKEVVYVPVPTPLDLSTVPTHELLAAAILRILSPTHGIVPTSKVPNLPLGEVKPIGNRFSEYDQYTQINKPITPKFGVVGLMKDQFNHLKARINQSVVNLVWIDKDQGNNCFPPNLDYVIVQRHTSHSHYNNARAQFGNDRVIFVDRGITQCADKIKEKYPTALN